MHRFLLVAIQFLVCVRLCVSPDRSEVGPAEARAIRCDQLLACHSSWLLSNFLAVFSQQKLSCPKEPVLNLGGQYGLKPCLQLRVVVPAIADGMVNHRVLVMEYVEGIKVTDRWVFSAYLASGFQPTQTNPMH